MIDSFDDILYDTQFLGIIRTEFPHAMIDEFFDTTHNQERARIELPKTDLDAFYKFSIKVGYAEMLMGFALMLRGIPSDGMQQIKRWVYEVETELS